ncbi:kinase-like domain-containing protein [Schizophyllum amplum]|uniref:non-specific serine/threonine protein kinase n=1 Tax=Schizophyllum amplum TaxID=97359 RepID=A0A550D018_9AGAR|nr:kinase-like domain-containing protein [Auriculariopsis ampla]
MPVPPPSKRSKTAPASPYTDRDVEEERLRPYVVTGHLGKGSFATVYKGYNEDTHQQVAIKTVKRDNLGTGKLLDNLQSEIQILKSLSHRHITRLYEIVRAEKNIYLIMEFCAAGDLTNYIKKRGRVEGLEYAPAPGAAPQYYPHPRTGGLHETVVRSFLRQLARALKFLRHRALIHRDIKPQNLLLNPAGPDEFARGHPLGVPVLKVADFGFARSLPNAMMAETLCGSPLYMAPEILRSEKYDAKVDLWSVGAVLYEMAVGKPPFRAQNHIELLNKIDRAKGIKFPDEEAQRAPADGTSSSLPVPPDIKKLIRALLKRVPVERASFEDFFGSTAMQKSKFPRPEVPPADASGNSSWAGSKADNNTPQRHKVIPPEVLDPTVMIPPSKFNFRRPSAGEGASNDAGPSKRPSLTALREGADGQATAPVSRRASGREPTHTQSPSPPRLSNIEASLIPGETEEDGLLRREYVMVGDTRALEFNRAIDELRIAPRRPLQERRTTGQPQEQRTTEVPHSQQRRTSAYGVPIEGRPPQHRRSSTYAGREATPLGSPIPDDGPSPEFMQERPATGLITFPPPPNNGIPPPTPPLSSSPSRAAANALNRALSLASKKLFGSVPRSPPTVIQISPTTRSSPAARGGEVDLVDLASSLRRPQLIGTADEERDPLEEELLGRLEELAQKTDVLTHWADEMYEYVKAVPQKPLPDPTKFEKKAGEAERQAWKRRHADVEAEYNAVTCVAVYMLLMSFSQKGIDQLRRHQEHMLMRHPDGDYTVSEGFDDALSWFRDHFLKCHERATLVKTWLPAKYDGPKTWLDQLVYDRALYLSRTAARKELLDQATAIDECEKLYEESLWCLYALQEDLLQTGNPFMEEDRETIATWIKRTKLRLVRCRARMAMDRRDRLKDARADENLADVARIPAPWDAKVAP